MTTKSLKTAHTLLFGENAETYARYRPKYPDFLFKTISKSIDGKKQKAIDVGAGTGISSVQLLQYFDEVIALEPDAKLANFIKKNLNNKGLSVVEGDFNSLHTNTAEIDIINCSASFHWLNSNEFLAKSKFSLRLGGAICINTPNIFPIFENELQHEITLEFNKVWKLHCHPNLDCLIDSDILLKKITNISHFSAPLKKTIDNIQMLKVKEVMGFFSTLSYFNSYLKTLSESTKLDYLKNLENVFKKHSEKDLIKMNFQIHLFHMIKI